MGRQDTIENISTRVLVPMTNIRTLCQNLFIEFHIFTEEMFRRKLYTKLTLPINPGDGNSFAIKELLKSKSKVFPEESLEVTVLNKDDLSFENKWVRERLFPIF